MSHHMSNLVHASDDECLSLVALLAFEGAAFDALYVGGCDQSDRGLPAACGAQSQYAQGGRLGGVHVVSFHFGTLCVSLESTSAARTSCDGVSIVLEPAPVGQSSLCNIDHFPTTVEPGFSCYFWVRGPALRPALRAQPAPYSFAGYPEAIARIRGNDERETTGGAAAIAEDPGRG